MNTDLAKMSLEEKEFADCLAGGVVGNYTAKTKVEMAAQRAHVVCKHLNDHVHDTGLSCWHTP